MARPPKGTESKKSVVEKYLAQGLKNKDVIEMLKREHKLTVSPNYVSLIKSKLGSSNGHARRRGRPAKSKTGFPTLTAAVEFVRAAGSVEAARQALSAVEEIRQLA